MSNASSKWSANRSTELHPLLQKLHSNGGTLYGSVDIGIPSWFVPQTEAYKTTVDGEYLFSVTLSAPFLGKLVSFSGNLKALSSNATAMDNIKCE